jgi:hypothetical protein
MYQIARFSSMGYSMFWVQQEAGLEFFRPVEPLRALCWRGHFTQMLIVKRRWIIKRQDIVLFNSVFNQNLSRPKFDHLLANSETFQPINAEFFF